MRSLLLVREAGPVAARALAQNYGSRLERRWSSPEAGCRHLLGASAPAGSGTLAPSNRSRSAAQWPPSRS